MTQKILCLVGPTASGKSSLGVQLAKKLNGEIISADSRQVYCGLDIGTGKITKREMCGVPHHLLDVAQPRRTFSAHDFSTHARRAIADIIARGRTPIVCGGTGFYIDALLGRVSLPDVPPDKAFRAGMRTKTAAQLFALLKQKDPARAQRMNESERKNPVRLIRALEIARSLGKDPKPQDNTPYCAQWIGIQPADDVLKKKITQRLDVRLRQGMVAEARRLHADGLSYKRMEELGLEYRALAQFLRGDITRVEMRDELLRDIFKYAKRQRIYWKRNKDIRWFPDAASALRWVTASSSAVRSGSSAYRAKPSAHSRRPRASLGTRRAETP